MPGRKATFQTKESENGVGENPRRRACQLLCKSRKKMSGCNLKAVRKGGMLELNLLAQSLRANLWFVAYLSLKEIGAQAIRRGLIESNSLIPRRLTINQA